VEWLASAPAAPRTVFVVHGEAEAAFALQRAIGERVGCLAVVPQHGERVRLD
jgi:metallo-beta-lactamase family protein